MEAWAGCWRALLSERGGRCALRVSRAIGREGCGGSERKTSAAAGLLRGDLVGATQRPSRGPAVVLAEHAFGPSCGSTFTNLGCRSAPATCVSVSHWDRPRTAALWRLVAASGGNSPNHSTARTHGTRQRVLRTAPRAVRPSALCCSAREEGRAARWLASRLRWVVTEALVVSDGTDQRDDDARWSNPLREPGG